MPRRRCLVPICAGHRRLSRPHLHTRRNRSRTNWLAPRFLRLEEMSCLSQSRQDVHQIQYVYGMGVLGKVFATVGFQPVLVIAQMHHRLASPPAQGHVIAKCWKTSPHTARPVPRGRPAGNHTFPPLGLPARCKLTPFHGTLRNPG